MEGDAGSGQLNPTPPNTGALSDAEESVTWTPDAEQVVLVEDDVLVTGAGADASGSTGMAGHPWFNRVCTALILASVSVAIGGALALWGHSRHAAADRNAAAALAAAKDCVTATQAPDAKAMAASATKIMDCATGEFATQAKIYGGVLVDAYQTANAQVEVSDLRAAVERQNPDGTIDVLVAIRTKLSNSEQQGQEQGYRLRVEMAPDGGTYKVARMDQVSQ